MSWKVICRSKFAMSWAYVFRVLFLCLFAVCWFSFGSFCGSLWGFFVYLVGWFGFLIFFFVKFFFLIWKSRQDSVWR